LRWLTIEKYDSHRRVSPRPPTPASPATARITNENFCSALRHDFTPASDIDLLVTFHPEARITFFQLDEIEHDFAQLFQRSVDAVTRPAIEHSHNPIRRQNILGNIQVIYPLALPQPILSGRYD
jgi:predicted nucleotidyltransferase